MNIFIVSNKGKESYGIVIGMLRVTIGYGYREVQPVAVEFGSVRTVPSSPGESIVEPFKESGVRNNPAVNSREFWDCG